MVNPTRAVVQALRVLLLASLATPAAAGEAERLAAERAAGALYEAGQYAEALDAATLRIEYASDEFGEDAPELIDPMIDLGDIHRKLAQHPRAIEAYERAATLIEINDGIFSGRLVELLRRIGETYHVWQRGDEAVEALQRAKVITHRNQGIMNLEQIPIIQDLTEVYVGQRDLLAASREQLFALRVAERRFGPDSPEVVPGLYRLADWYRRTRQWSRARDLYRRAATILENAYGAADLRLVPALTGIAATFRGERSMRSEGRESLERVVTLYETAENADAADHGAALVSLGDWLLMTGDREGALASYTRAWQLMTEAAGGSTESATRQLGRPTRLRYDPPLPDQEWTVTRIEESSTLYVEVEFTVEADGTVSAASVVDSNAPNRVARQVKLAVLQARYRPAFEDGRPVARLVRVKQSYPDLRPTALSASGEEAKPDGGAAAAADAQAPAATPPPAPDPQPRAGEATDSPAAPAPETP